MRMMWAIAAAVGGFVAIAALAADPTERAGTDQTKPPIVPPARAVPVAPIWDGRAGVLTPPPSVDPEMKRTPPPAGDSMPVIPPPGTPGGDPSIKPK
jgi:hypothetical protein